MRCGWGGEAGEEGERGRGGVSGGGAALREAGPGGGRRRRRTCTPPFPPRPHAALTFSSSISMDVVVDCIRKRMGGRAYRQGASAASTGVGGGDDLPKWRRRYSPPLPLRSPWPCRAGASPTPSWPWAWRWPRRHCGGGGRRAGRRARGGREWARATKERVKLARAGRRRHLPYARGSGQFLHARAAAWASRCRISRLGGRGRHLAAAGRNGGRGRWASGPHLAATDAG